MAEYGAGWAQRVRAKASGLSSTQNPPFTTQDFYGLYPQFAGEEAKKVLPEAVVGMFVRMADSIVKKSRWGESWQLGMGLLIAHLCTLHLQGAVPEGAGVAEIASAGAVTGVATSKSVGGVSVSYDVGMLLQGMEDWGAYRLTQYGVQFATMAEFTAAAGMLV